MSDVKIHGPPKPVLNSAMPLTGSIIKAEKPMRADQISLLIHTNRIMREKLKENEIMIKEMKKEFKALYWQKYEDYVDDNIKYSK